MSTGYWGRLANEHWQRHSPTEYAALKDPDRFFAWLDEEATEQYQVIRDGMLDGVNPNNGTIGWAKSSSTASPKPTKPPARSSAES